MQHASIRRHLVSLVSVSLALAATHCSPTDAGNGAVASPGDAFVDPSSNPGSGSAGGATGMVGAAGHASGAAGSSGAGAKSGAAGAKSGAAGASGKAGASGNAGAAGAAGKSGATGLGGGSTSAGGAAGKAQGGSGAAGAPSNKGGGAGAAGATGDAGAAGEPGAAGAGGEPGAAGTSGVAGAAGTGSAGAAGMGGDMGAAGAQGGAASAQGGAAGGDVGAGGAAPPSCVPTTCAAGGLTCGSVSDGCGATLSCGTCTLPQTCGGTGIANVCGTPPTSPPNGGGTLRIMPLGDSITLGVNGGYRNGLWDRLVAAGRTVDFVGSQHDQYTIIPDKDHEGHPGFTIGDIASNADAWLASAKPDYVLLMIGTNDVAWWCAQTAAQVADTDAALIDKIFADLPNAWVIVASIPPEASSIIQPNNVDRATLATQYNAEIKTRVQTRIAAGKKLRFADVNSVLGVSDLYDGIHPTQAAHDKVAQVWFDALTPILP